MQKIEPKIVELKNNRTVLIRQAELADAENLLHCIKTYVRESEYIPKLEQEIKLSVEQEQDWINSFLTNANSLLLVAEHHGQIIGNIDLTGSRRKAIEHTARCGNGYAERLEKRRAWDSASFQNSQLGQTKFCFRIAMAPSLCPKSARTKPLQKNGF